MAGCAPGAAGTDTTTTDGATESASATSTIGSETPTGSETSAPTGTSTTTESATGTSTSTTTESATDTSSSTTTESATDTGEPLVCPCILHEEEGQWGHESALPICGEPLCPTVEVDTDPFDGSLCDVAKPGDAVPLVNPEALTCALTALRDRTPGLIGWNCGEHQGYIFSDSGYVLIDADGTAIRRNWGAYDLSYTVRPARQGALPDPDVFEQCLADGDVATRFECLRRFAMGEPLLVCDDLWSVSQG